MPPYNIRSILVHSRVINSSVLFNYSSVYYFSSRTRPDPRFFLFRPDNAEIMDDFKEKLGNEEVKYRRHPGIVHLNVQKVDKEIQKAIGRILVKSDSKVPQYKEKGKQMEQQLHYRRLPMEQYDIVKVRGDIERRLRETLAKRGQTPENCETEEERLALEELIQNKADRRLQTSIYRWKPMQYDTKFKCMTYCVMRFAPEYTVLRRVFNEIVKREPGFKPRHVLDFGSGVGTTFFATEASWPRKDHMAGETEAVSVEEYFCIEPNEEMNDVFRLLLRDGDPESEPRHRNVIFRSYLPASSDRQYDLVVSAYSLLELPSYEERMRTVANLWMKTNDFLVLIERGTNHGFRAVIEARDYILAGAHEIYRKDLPSLVELHNVNIAEVERILKEKKTTESEKFRRLRERYPEVKFPTLLPHGHVFAPCPHDMGCPRLMDITPCNFPARYFPLRLSGGEEVDEEEVFSFVILRKGYAPTALDRWPRIVREPRKSKACIWCQTCTPHGVLEDKPFHKGPASSERGKQFRLAMKSFWGDMMPIVTSYDAKKAQAETGKNAAFDDSREEEEEYDDENTDLNNEGSLEGEQDLHGGEARDKRRGKEE